MKKINEAATRIFSRVLDKLGKENYIKLTSADSMALIVERLEQDIVTDSGKGETISLCHYYKENGALCRDLEMCFIVVDNRRHPKDYPELHIYPQYYRNDNMALEEESIQIEKKQVTAILKLWQNGHCQFANIWLKKIRSKGFLQ